MKLTARERIIRYQHTRPGEPYESYDTLLDDAKDELWLLEARIIELKAERKLVIPAPPEIALQPEHRW